MESWDIGRERLLAEVGRIYDNIGKNIQNELDEVNTIRVWRSQLAALEKQAERAKRIEEDRDRLAAELEQAKSAIQRVDELEINDKRLRQELESLLRKREHDPHKETATPGCGPESTPVSDVPGGTATIIPKEEQKVRTKTVAGEDYNMLAKKYNDLAENWKYEKKMRKEQTAKYEMSKVAAIQWQAMAERRERHVGQRDKLIESLKAQLQRYVGHPQDDVTQEELPGAENAMLPPQFGNNLLFTSKPTSLEKPLSLSVNQDTVDSVSPSRRAGAQPVPSLSTTTTVDILSDPPTVPFRADLPEVASAEVYPDNFADGSSGAREPGSPIILPALPKSSHVDVIANEHSSSTTDEEALSRLDAEFDKEKNIDVTYFAGNSSPEIVSTRKVNKRKGRHGAQTKSPRKRIKVEITSSPIGASRLVNSSDSLDLDEIGTKSNTPRKQQRIRELAQGRRALSDDTESPRTESQRLELNRLRAVSEQIAQETPIRPHVSNRKKSVLQPKSVNEQILPRLAARQASKAHRVVSDRDIGNLIEGGEVPRASTTNVMEVHNSDGKLQDLLAGKFPDKVVLSPAHLPAVTKSATPKETASRLLIFNDYPTLGEQLSKSPARQTAQKPQNTTEALTTPKLSSFDDSGIFVTPQTGHGSMPPHEQTSRMMLSKLPTTWDIPKIARSAEYNSAKKQLPIPDFAGPNVTKATPTSNKPSSRKADMRPTRTAQTEEEWEHDPNQEPIRLRPVESLRLEDFKVNPNYNQGYNFAFREVVRDKDSRQAMQGCIKPGCCLEKFRAMAIAQRNPNDVLTPEQQAADKELLEEYLGDNISKLQSMNQAQKNGLLLQARIRKIANQHGRHKHAYERASTPPGFWRADFATTQEEADDRAQASQEYRVQVRQRYEEAIRGNGRYLFRDE